MGFRSFLIGVLLACQTIHFAQSLPEGAPASACGSLTPDHPGEIPQTSQTPYTIQLSSSQVNAGETVDVTLGIASPTVPHFRGLLVRGSSAIGDTVAAGNMELLPNTSTIEIVTCEGGDGVTHTDTTPKTTVTFQWRAPEQPGEYIILATIAQEFSIFWVGQASQTITVV